MFMKKKLGFILLIGLFLPFISACQSGNSVSSQEVTYIEIAGSKQVKVGKTITLTANTEVNWSSLDETIATINKEGVLTGISPGEVTIVATSKVKPDLSKSVVISVVSENAKEIKLQFESDEVEYDEKTKTYNVPLGKTYLVTCVVEKDYNAPSSYSFSFLNLADSSYTSSFDYEFVSNNQIAITSYEEVSNVSLVCKAYFDTQENYLQTAIVLNAIDLNESNLLQVQEKLAAFKEVETESLLSSKLTINKTKVVGETTTNEKTTYNHSSYTNASYIKSNKKTYTNNSLQNEEILNYFQGNYNNTYYAFSYDENDIIQDVYYNENINDTNAISSKLMMRIFSQTPSYGYADMLLKLFDQYTNLGDPILSLGNSSIYAYAKFEITNTLMNISSSYNDNDNNLNYNISLQIKFNEANQLTEYDFIETYVGENESVTYEEKAIDFVYGEKVVNLSSDTNYLDINKYLLTSFEVVSASGEVDEDGKYDFSDETKYGIDEITEVDGIKKYTLTYEKTLAVKIDAMNPSTANLDIDNIIVTSSDTSQIDTAGRVGGNIYTINPKKDENGNTLPGIATFTFTSSKGYSTKIIVNFVKGELKGMIVSNISNNSLGEVFLGSVSNYFFLNTNPDEGNYNFSLQIIEGEKDGISLYEFTDTNIYGYPGFSYGILANKEGAYTFRFYVEGYQNIYSEEYSITVLPKKTQSELVEHFVTNGLVYERITETMSIEISFPSITEMQLSVSYYGGTPSTEIIPIHFIDGAIVVDETYTFSQSNMYYSRVKQGNIEFDLDLNNIYILLEVYDENKTLTYDDFNRVKFSLQIDKSDFMAYVNGKEASCQEFITSISGMVNFNLSFSSSSATLNIKLNSTKENLAIITFNYSFDSTSSKMIVSNEVSSNEDWSLNVDNYAFGDYYSATGKLVLNILHKDSGQQISFTF